jgi:hypothetical protein
VMRHRLIPQTELVPNWTAAPEQLALVSSSIGPGDGVVSRGNRTPPAAAPSTLKLGFELRTLQNRSIAKFSTLLLVWHLIILTIGGMAYDLLD